MSIKKLIIITALIIVTVTATATVTAKKPTISEDIAIWELTKITVVEQGQNVDMQEGDFFTNYVIEARAHQKNGNIIPNGVFRMSLSAFSPYQKIGTQSPGYWYVQGSWTITKDNPNLAAMEAKHNSEVIEGSIVAEVPFNPISDWDNWTGLARLTMTLMAGNWANGEGTLTFNKDNSGSLFLDLAHWPDMSKETTQ